MIWTAQILFEQMDPIRESKRSGGIVGKIDSLMLFFC